MPIIETRATIDRPLADVWDLWTDVRRLPELSASTTKVVDAPERLRHRGQTFRQRTEGFGRSLETMWTVDEVESGSRIVVTSRPVPGVTVRLTEMVEPAPDGATLATLRVEYALPFGPAGRLVSRLGIEQRARREAAEVVEGLGRLLTTTTSP